MSDNSEKWPSCFPKAQGDIFQIACFVQTTVQNPKNISFIITKDKEKNLKLENV